MVFGLGYTKRVKLLNFENDTLQVIRNLFAAKAAVRIVQEG